MLPSMMLYRRRLLQGERIGEGTILGKKYLSRFTSALRASQAVLIPCPHHNNSNNTISSDLEQLKTPSRTVDTHKVCCLSFQGLHGRCLVPRHTCVCSMATRPSFGPSLETHHRCPLPNHKPTGC